MKSVFWDNVLLRLGKAEKSQKWLASLSGVGKTVINSGISRKSTPSADNAYSIAKVFSVSIEELLDGEAGAEYVQKIAKNDPRGVQVPDRIAPIVQSLLLLDDKELVGIRANVEALAEAKKEREAGAAGA